LVPTKTPPDGIFTAATANRRYLTTKRKHRAGCGNEWQFSEELNVQTSVVHRAKNVLLSVQSESDNDESFRSTIFERL
jgi:hypothetical protein